MCNTNDNDGINGKNYKMRMTIDTDLAVPINDKECTNTKYNNEIIQMIDVLKMTRDDDYIDNENDNNKKSSDNNSSNNHNDNSKPDYIINNQL